MLISMQLYYAYIIRRKFIYFTWTLAMVSRMLSISPVCARRSTASINNSGLPSEEANNNALAGVSERAGAASLSLARVAVATRSATLLPSCVHHTRRRGARPIANRQSTHARQPIVIPTGRCATHTHDMRITLRRTLDGR